MAKVKRSVLKQLIKECLVEILVEGISADSNNANALIEAVSPRSSSTERKKYDDEVERINNRRKKLDSVKATALNEQIINHVTDDPTMAEIFRDTAQTTLAEQGLSNNAHDTRRVAADKASQAVANSNPEDLFEGAGNWATLAFGNNDE